MKILQTPVTICENPLSHFAYFAWPTVGRLPDGSLAFVSSGFRLRHVCPFGKTVIGYSTDDGKTWTSPTPVIDTALDDRDGGICTVGKRVIVTSFNNTRAFQRGRLKEDDALAPLIQAYLDTVTDEEEARFFGSTYRISEDGGYHFGALHRAPVTSPHGPCAAPNGDVFWVGVHMEAGVDDHALLCCKLDREDRFCPIGTLPSSPDLYHGATPCELHAAVLPNGTILTAIRAQKGAEILTTYLCESEDGGKTWSLPRQILGDDDGAPPHLLPLPNGDLLLSYACRAKGRRGIRARLSRDNGKTWGEEMHLADSETADLGYTSTVLRKDGSFLSVYYENINGIAVLRQVIWEI